jgi:bifunctional UDP-N-acetylglucosamine pyrophosphorylase/glucosamine-1-phosphate N-acetyltransferase
MSNMEKPLHVVILAAGKGTRMKSALPKVLHPVAGRPMLLHVLETAHNLHASVCHVVHGHGGEAVRAAVDAQPQDMQVDWAEQTEQLGTAHAVLQAMPAIPDHAAVLVLYGDVPLIRPQTLVPLLEAGRNGLAVLSTRLRQPTGYGRIIRDAEGALRAIVEEKDADAAQREIREVNTGVLCADAALLRRWLSRVGNDNAKGEYYLTDVVALAVADGLAPSAVMAAHAAEVEGVNDRRQLAQAERSWQRRQAQQLMLDGVAIADPARFDLRGRLRVGMDVSIDVGVIIEGDVEIGDGVQVGPYTILRDARIGAGARIGSHCVIERAEVGPEAQVGPYARLRPGAMLDRAAHVGNFVEVKNSRIGVGSKANHLSYIGDADVGTGVNIGAGTITCNYDGANKHRTVIEDGAFIGSDTALVAPVRIGRNATIGAGSVITRDAPEDALTLARSREQKSYTTWKRPKKGDPA